MEADAKLRQFIDEILSLNEQIQGLQIDKSEFFKAAKADGYDTKAMKALIRRLGMKPEDREEADALLVTYWNSYHNAPARAREAA